MCKDEETAIFGPEKMIVIPPRHSLVVQNPVLTRKDDKGNTIVCYDRFGQAMLRHGDSEVRLSQDPFPLYPGEIAHNRTEPLQVLEPNTALRVMAARDFVDKYTTDTNGNPLSRRAGQHWLVHGPGTFIPHVEQRVVSEVRPTLLKPGEALRLRARRNFTDRNGQKRIIGSDWLYTQVGSFLPDVDEEIIGIVKPQVLTDKIALRVRADHAFIDEFEIPRKPGEEWLVTRKDTETFIPHVHSTVVAVEQIITLDKRQWCVLMNKYKDGVPQYGHEEIIRGEKNFFLFPGEKIGQIQNVVVLTAEQGLKVQAMEDFEEDSTGKKVRRTAGEYWTIKGPREYWPTLEIAMIGTVNSLFTVGNYSFFK